MILILIISGCTNKESKPTFKILPDSVVWGVWGEVPHMNPFSSVDIKVWGIQSLVWDPLITLDSEGRWHPHLAKSWQLSEDLKSITLVIVPDLKWNDGLPVTEADFKFSFSFYKHPKLKASVWQGVFSQVKNVSYTSGSLQIELHTAGKFSDWNRLLSMTRLFPAEALSADRGPIKNTGPYQVHQFSSTRPWALSKNPHSWQAQIFPEKFKAYPSQIVIHKVLSKSVLEGLIRKNTLDAFVDYGVVDFDSQNMHPLSSQKIDKLLLINLEDEQLKKRLVRQCVFASLPTQAEFQRLYSNQSLGFSSHQLQAQLTLKSDPVCEKISLKVSYVLNSDKKWLEYWQEKAKNLGLDLELVKQGNAKAQALLSQRNYQIFITEEVGERSDQWPTEVFHSKGAYNSQGWNDSKLDQLLTQRSKIFDFTQRKQMNSSIQHHVMQELGVVYIYDSLRPLAWTRRACNEDSGYFWWKILLCMSKDRALGE